MNLINFWIKEQYNKIKMWWIMRSVRKDLKRIDKDINDKLSR